MIQKIYIFLISFLTIGMTGVEAMGLQNSNPNTIDAKHTEVTAIINGCTQNVGLYQFDGIAFKKVAGAKYAKNDTFIFIVAHQSPIDIYYVGTYDGQKKSVLIGNEKQVVVRANCKSIRAGKVENSALNTEYNTHMDELKRFKTEHSALGRSMRTAQNDPNRIKEIETKFASLDKRKLDLMKKLKKKNPYLAKIIGLEAYQSYAGNKMNYKSEVDHYVNEYFAQVDLSDADYNNIPYLYEAFTNYAKTLASIKLPEEQMKSALGLHLQKIPQDSRAYKYALGGTVMGLQAKNHPSFVDFGSLYTSKYAKDKTPDLANLAKQIGNARSFNIGAEAPDFTQNTPEGEPLSLSDLKGKVVLIDFWASWCGPCRRENPKVVQIYNKYKDKGFDILGVSLDRTKDRWVQAIKKDKLTWNHVSDLKGWSNAAAGTYSVRSIPSTVLVDAEGKIIARNFRAHELEGHLQRIFGD